MTAVQFLVNEVFDLPARGGLIAVGSTRNGEFTGIPHLRDEASGHPIRVLGVDHPTPRTLRTGESIIVVDRADAEYVVAGRLWTAPVLSRMEKVTAVGERDYEVVFDGTVEPSTVLCTVDMSGVVPVVSAEPDPFMSGHYGDPRPIVAVVLAMHRARRPGAPPVAGDDGSSAERMGG